MDIVSANTYDCVFISTRVSFASEKAYPPIGPGYLARQLIADGYRVQVVDLQLDPEYSMFTPERLTMYIEGADAPVVGISLFGDMLPTVLAAIGRLPVDFGKRILLGGPGVNGSEQDILDQYPQVWAAVRGEADDIISELLESALHGTGFTAPNVACRANGRPAPLKVHRIKNIGDYGSPGAEALQLDQYDRVSLLTSRGCPFDCSFCDIITMWGRRVSYRPIGDVVRELERLAGLPGGKKVDIIDDTFTVDKKRVYDFCAEVRGRELDVEWTCFSRIDTLNEDLVVEMAAAGCANIYFGIDAGSELRWRKIHKRLNKERVLETLAYTLPHTNATASFIWGYPDESFDEFLDTLSLAYEIAKMNAESAYQVRVQLHLLSPTRSTPIYADFSERLEFSTAAKLDLLGTSLDSFNDLPAFEELIALMQTDAAKFAPFHLYRSDDGDLKKQAMTEALAAYYSSAARALFSPDQDVSLDADRAQAETLTQLPDPLKRAVGLLLGIWLNCAVGAGAEDGLDPGNHPLVHLRRERVEVGMLS